MKNTSRHHPNVGSRKHSTVRIGTIGVPSRHTAKTLLRHVGTTEAYVGVPASVMKSLPVDPKAESAAPWEIGAHTNRSSGSMGLGIKGQFPSHPMDRVVHPTIQVQIPIRSEAPAAAPATVVEQTEQEPVWQPDTEMVAS